MGSKTIYFCDECGNRRDKRDGTWTIQPHSSIGQFYYGANGYSVKGIHVCLDTEELLFCSKKCLLDYIEAQLEAVSNG